MHALNDTAAFVWQLCDGRTSPAELAAALSAKASIDDAEAVVQLTLQEYERVRAQDDRFAVEPGHETGEIEHVIERNDRFLIVDKVDAVERFTADDPRGAPST